MSAATSGSAQTVDRKAEWETRLDHAAEEILGLYQDRFIWHQISDIAFANQVVRDNPFIPSWIGTQFYRRAIVSVRTMVDAGQPGREHETDSLVTVLNDIIAHPHDLMVGEHTGMQLAGARTIDPAAVQADVDQLRKAAAAIKKYSNKYITHIDRQPKAPVPREEEIEAAIDRVGELLKKYMLLIAGRDLDLETRILFDWTGSLAVSWLSPQTGGAIPPMV